MVVRNRLLLAGTTLLLAGGCFYSFNNPVAAQTSGSIAGQLSLNDAAEGQTLTGATVTLQWSGLTVNVGKTGRFLFVGLPAGTFTLRYDLPAKAGNLFPLVGFRHNLVLPGDPGAADAINLGTVPITPTGRVQGTISGGNGTPITLGAFTPLQPDGGGHDYEGYATQTDATGAFSLLLPAGNHDLACSTTDAVDAQPVSLVSQQVLTKDLGLASTSLPQSSVSGFLVFGDLGANASGSQVDVRGPFIDATVQADDGTVVTAPLNPASQVPGVGASFEVNLPTGHKYKLTLVLNGQAGSAQDCGYFPPLVIDDLAAVGQVIQLGQVAWLQSGVFISNGGAGACNGSDGGVDAGITWQLLNAAAPEDAGAVLEVVPLPVSDGDGGTKGHRLAWIQGGQVYSADDVATSGVSYGPATAIWADATNPVHAITGTSTAAGGAAFGWVEASIPQATVAYYPPGASSETPTITSFALSVVPAVAPSTMALVAGSDSTGTPGLWVLILQDNSIGGYLDFWFTSDFVTYSRVVPIVPPDPADAGPTVDAGPPVDAGPTVDAGLLDAGTGGFDAGPADAIFQGQFIAGTPCSLPELDGGQGVCFVSTVNLQPFGSPTIYHWAYDGVLDTQQALPVLSVQLVVDAGDGENLGIPAITAAPASGGNGLSSVASGWRLDTTVDIEYQVTQFTTLATTPAWSKLPTPYNQPADDGILLQWQGAPLEVALFLNNNPNGIGSVSLGSVTPPPFLPGFGVAQLLHGYADPNGSLFIAAYDNPASEMTTQLGLFVWPPQP